MENIVLRIKSVANVNGVLGVLADLPPGIWQHHERGRGWLAIIKRNFPSPGGLERKFLARANTECFYVIPNDLNAPLAVEFGADLITKNGKKISHRWYGVILEIRPDAMILRDCQTAISAIALADARNPNKPANKPALTKRRLRI